MDGTSTDRTSDMICPGGTSADRIPDARYPRKVERWQGRIPDVRHPGGMLAEKNSGCETSGWNVGGE